MINANMFRGLNLNEEEDDDYKPQK